MWKDFRESITEIEKKRLYPSEDYRSIPLLRRVHHKFHILKDLLGKNHQSQKGFKKLILFKEELECEDQVSYSFSVLGEQDFAQTWIEPSDSLIPWNNNQDEDKRLKPFLQCMQTSEIKSSFISLEEEAFLDKHNVVFIPNWCPKGSYDDSQCGAIDEMVTLLKLK